MSNQETTECGPEIVDFTASKSQLAMFKRFMERVADAMMMIEPLAFQEKEGSSRE